MRRTAIVRYVLLAAWIVWAALAWWTAPRLATLDQLQRDAAGDQVSSVERSSGWDDDGFWGRPRIPQRSLEGSMVVWQLRDGRTRYRYVDNDGTPAPATDSRVESLTAALGRSGPPMLTPGRIGAITTVLAIVFLAVLLGGPTPVRGTRWFWFWVALLPFGLGGVAWLAYERPWSRRAAVLDTVEPVAEHRERRSGWRGFGYLIVGTFAIGVLVFGLHRLFGEWLVPA